MSALGVVLYYVLSIYLLVLFVRFVIELVQSFRPGWRPSGALVVVFEVVYTATDPPLRLLRRFIPPLRVGNVAFDLAFLLLFVVVSILRAEVLAL